MTIAALVNALLYELAKGLIERRPALAFHPLIIRLLAWCKLDWEEWKVSNTMKDVLKQTVQLTEQWERQEYKDKEEVLVAQARELFPHAIIVPVEAAIPSIIITHEADDSASDAVKALGGEMRITYTLDS